LDSPNVRQLTTGAQVDRGVAESPDGERIAFGANRAGAYNVWRVGAEGSGPVQLTFGNGDLKPAFSPDGRWVIFQLVLVWLPTVWKSRLTAARQRN